MNKPIEYWVALASAALWVFMSHKEKTWVMRLLISVMSWGIGFSVSKDVADFTGRSETMSGMFVVAFAWVILDFLTSLFADREAMTKAFWDRVGGKK